MNWIKRLIQKRKRTVALKKLNEVGLKYNRNTSNAPSFLINGLIYEL